MAFSTTFFLLLDDETVRRCNCYRPGSTLISVPSVSSFSLILLQKSRHNPKHYILKATSTLIIGNTVSFQISVESPVAQLFHTKDSLLPNNSGNHMTPQNPMRCTGNLKAKIRDNLVSVFVAIECYFHLDL